MDSLSFWAMVVWSVAVCGLWCHAMWLYRRTQASARRTLELLDDAERWRLK